MRSPISMNLNKNAVFPFFLLLFLFIFTPAESPGMQKKEAPDQKVTFHFVDVDLTAVTKFVSEITGKNFIYDDRLKGKITIIAPTKIGLTEAFNLFTSVLELKGFTVIPSGVDAYKIVPSAEVKQKGVEIFRENRPVNESYIARLITLQNISSDDVLKFVQPMVSKDGYVASFGPGNMILVIDSGLNVEKILAIADIIDKPSTREKPDIVPLRYASADTVAKMLNEGFARNRVSGMPGQGGNQTEQARVIADSRLNAIILFGDRSTRESMKALVASIDVPSPDTLGRINVYFLEYADATDLVKVLEGIIKSAQQIQRPIAGTGTQQVTPFESGTGISITADKASNSLVIVASPSDYQSISQIIAQLDKKRRQVFVEALIAEVAIDNLLELGLKWRAAVEKDGKPIFIGGVGTIDQAAIQSVITGLTGLTVGGLGNYYTIPKDFIAGATSDVTVPGISAILNLNEFKDVVNVLSNPQILTSDNKEAEIVVGENIPMISQRERNITTTNTVLNSIERRDVGIVLRITPHITEGDHVKLDIYQEISTPKTESENIIINVGPTITKRSTKTAVLVKDRQTVVIGGLIEEKDTHNVTKVPLLGDIPVLGFLFSSKSIKRKKINLIVFITPHVVKEQTTLDSLTLERQRRFAVTESRYAENELVVRFRENIPEPRAQELIAAQGATVIRNIEGTSIYFLKLRDGQSVEKAVSVFTQYPEVLYAEPNYRINKPSAQ